MRILICAQEAPLDPVNGFRTQVARVAGALAAAHDVRVLALLSPDQRPAPERGELRLVPAVPRALRRPDGRRRAPPAWAAPAGYARFAGRLRAPLRDELRAFAPDLVYVAGVRLAALWRELGDVPRVVAPLDAAHLGVEAQAVAARGTARPLLRAAARRVRAFEAAEYAHFDRVLVLSTRDRDALLGLAPGMSVEVIPHAVDTVAFAPAAATADRRLIVFAGVMSAAPNVTAVEFLARRVLPRVRDAVPDAHLAVVGRTPPRRVRALARLDGVRVVGEVPDMAAWLAGSRACVAPMFTGSGVKNKLLEGMASGLPCVTTPRALGGLRATPGRHLLVGATAAELAAHAVRVLRDDGLAATLGAQARAYVVAEHGHAALAAELQRVCEEVAAARRGRSAQRSMSHVWSDSPPSTTTSAPVT
ncbi:MAG TPA: glycosyltransferase [Solirubrobacteraceae bacterium]|nr:glycosyltransferase [Solirubrobacteraceae bacterium]